MQSHLRNYPNLAGKPFGRDGATEARKVVDDIVRSGEWNPEPLARLLEASRNDPARPVILSNESLIEMPQREWFDGLVGPFEVAHRLATINGQRSVLFTLRDPRTMLRSTWLHHVREGRLQTYGDYLSRIASDRALRRGPFSVAALVDTYAELFGPERMVVGFTEDFTSDPGHFWNRFAAVFGVTDFAPAGSEAVPRLNETVLGPIGYEMAVNRVLRLYGIVTRRRNTRNIRRWMTRRVSRRVKTDHDRFFARFADAENDIVAGLEGDFGYVRSTCTVL